MRVELLFPSRYFKGADFCDGDRTLTITAVVVEELKMKGGKPEKKPVVYFEEVTDKALVLNKTNAMAIAALHGTETDAWHSKKITLGLAQDRMGGEMVDCVRVKGNGKGKGK